MLDFLTGGGWKLYAIGAVAVVMAGYVTASQIVLHNRQVALNEAAALATRLAEDKAVLQRQVDQVVALNAENAAELGRLKAAHARDMADVAADLERARKASQRVIVVRQEIARDPDAQAPLASVCGPAARDLDRLRREAGGITPPDSHPGRAGGGRASPSPAPVRAGTPPP